MEGIEDRRELEQRRFRFDATINVAHIITTLGLLTAVFTWGADIKSMLVKHETEISEIKQSRAQSSAVIQTQLSDLKSDVRLIGAKLDRVIEGRRRD